MTPSPDLSVVVPCFDERENLRPLVEAVRGALERTGRAFELVITDDASTDGSWEELEALAREFPFLRAQRFRANCGQSAALEAGLRAARAPILITMDGDLQNDPAEVHLLLAALGPCDCAAGDRSASRRQGYGTVRVFSSRIANWIRNTLSGESFADSACNFRAMRRECVENVRFFNGAHRFLTTLIKMEGHRVLEVPVTAKPRLRGKSKYGVWNRALRAFHDLLAVRWMKSRSYRYVIERTAGGTPAVPGTAAGTGVKG